MDSRIKKFVIAALALAVLAPVTVVRAESKREQRFDKNHPRRSEVNDRVKNQRRLLKQRLKSGKITQQQYDQQIKQLKNVKSEERADVKANGGYITKDQQKALNQELNTSRRQINANNGAAGGASGGASGGTSGGTSSAPPGQ